MCFFAGYAFLTYGISSFFKLYSLLAVHFPALKYVVLIDDTEIRYGNWLEKPSFLLLA